MYDFLYTNVGKGLLDENQDYSVKRFREYDGVQEVAFQAKKFLLSLEFFCKAESEHWRTLASSQNSGSYLVLQGMAYEKIYLVVIVHAALGEPKARRGGDFYLEGRVFLSGKMEEIPENLSWERVLPCDHPLPWLPRFTNISEAKLTGWLEDKKLAPSDLSLLYPNTVVRVMALQNALAGKAQERAEKPSLLVGFFLFLCFAAVVGEYFFFTGQLYQKEVFFREKAAALSTEILDLSHSLDLLDRLSAQDSKLQQSSFAELERKIDEASQYASPDALDFQKTDFVPLAYQNKRIQRYVKPSLNLIDNEVLVSELQDRIQKQSLADLQNELDSLQSPYLRFLLQKNELSDWSKRVAKRLYWQEICAASLKSQALYSPFQIYRLLKRGK